jgi:hypothetical protein
MSLKPSIELIFSSFPFVREYRLKRKMLKKRKRAHKKISQERDKYFKRYLTLERSIRRF